MLPSETLNDVVSFLGYYDLGGLKFTSKPFSAVANKCADAIRVFDFSEFAFLFQGSDIHVCQLDEDGDFGDWVCHLELATDASLADFIAKAFRNCTVGRIVLDESAEQVRNAIKEVANTIFVASTLDVTVRAFGNVQAFFEFIESLRGLKVWFTLAHTYEPGYCNDSVKQFTPIVPKSEFNPKFLAFYAASVFFSKI